MGCPPRARRRSDDDCLDVGSHRVFYICWHEQETTYRILFEFALPALAEADLERSLNNRDPGI